MANIGYIRVSTNKQDTDNQRLAILDSARSAKIHIDDFLIVEASSRQTARRRRIEELLARLKNGDTLYISELSRIGRSTVEVIDVVNGLIAGGIGLVSLKPALCLAGKLDMQGKVMLTLFSLLGELERDLIGSRTREALAVKKAAGVRLGKPPGTIQTSRLDVHRPDIERLLSHKVPKAAIARVVSCSLSTLKHYIKSRKLA